MFKLTEKLEEWYPEILCTHYLDPPLTFCLLYIMCVLCGGPPEIKLQAYPFISEYLFVSPKDKGILLYNHTVKIKFRTLIVPNRLILIFNNLPVPNPSLYLAVTSLQFPLIWNNSLAFVLHSMKSWKLFKECSLIWIILIASSCLSSGYASWQEQ